MRLVTLPPGAQQRPLLLRPVRFDEQVAVGDIVFCTVRPTGYFYAHNVKEMEWRYDRGCWKYWISNLARLLEVLDQ